MAFFKGVIFCLVFITYGTSPVIGRTIPNNGTRTNLGGQGVVVLGQGRSTHVTTSVPQILSTVIATTSSVTKRTIIVGSTENFNPEMETTRGPNTEEPVKDEVKPTIPK